MPLEGDNISVQLAKLRSLNRRIPRIVGALAVRHFKQSFRDQGFKDQVVDKWKPRKERGRRSRRAILVKSGALRRSVRVIQTGTRFVKVGSNLPYAQIHNEGGQVNATQQVSRHERKAHTRKQRGRRVKVQAHSVSAHKRQLKFNMPKRQFIGVSRALNRKINRKIVEDLNKILS